MKKSILSFLKLYSFNDATIKEAIQNKHYGLLSIGLKKYNHLVRRKILFHLRNKKFHHPSLFKTVNRIVQFDYINHAELALEIVNQNAAHYLNLKKEIQFTQSRFEERKRRFQNKRAYFKAFKPRTNIAPTVDKSKMKQLERLKQQLKKSIRLW